MKPNKKTITHAIICSAIFFTIMLFFTYLNYIDFSVIRAIYLPIYIIAIVAILFRQYLFSYIFTTSAGLGLVIEYIIHLSQENPIMKGAFFNTLIIFLGFIIGVMMQFVKKVRGNSMKAGKGAAAIGIIGVPDEETIAMLEKEWGKPIKKIEKSGKIILLVGKGLFKKKIVIPIEK